MVESGRLLSFFLVDSKKLQSSRSNTNPPPPLQSPTVNQPFPLPGLYVKCFSWILSLNPHNKLTR